MAKSYTTVWVRGDKDSSRGLAKAKRLLQHQFRAVNDLSKLPRGAGVKFFNEENEKWNLYLDNEFNLATGHDAFKKAVNQLDDRLNIFKNVFEKANFGNDCVPLHELVERILKVDWKIFKSNKKLKDELLNLKSINIDFKNGNPNKPLVNFLNRNKDLNFRFKYQHSPIKNRKRRRTFDEWISGFKIHDNKKSSGKSPSLINDQQIHFSREFFEKYNLVEYKKIRQMNKYGVVELVNIGIKKVNHEALKKWFNDSVEWYKNKLIESYGDTKKFLGASLHLDESKPHINFQIDNFLTDTTVLAKKYKTKQEIIPIFENSFSGFTVKDIYDIFLTSGKNYSDISNLINNGIITKAKDDDLTKWGNDVTWVWTKEEIIENSFQWTKLDNKSIQKLKNSNKSSEISWYDHLIKSKEIIEINNLKHRTGWDGQNELIYNYKELTNEFIDHSREYWSKELGNELKNEIQDSGFTKELYGLENYNALDVYRRASEKNKINFKNEPIENIITKFSDGRDIMQVRAQNKDELIDLLKEISQQFKKGNFNKKNKAIAEFYKLTRNMEYSVNIVNDIIENIKNRDNYRSK